MPSRRDVLRFASAAAVASLAGCTARAFDAAYTADSPDDGEWLSTRRGPRNTACAPNASPPRESPTVAWRTGPARPVHELLVAGDAVYTTHPVRARAVDAETGEVRWTTGGRDRAMLPGGRRVACLADETLYTVGTERLRAYDRDGTLRWDRDVREATSDHLRNYGLQVADGVVVLGFHGGLAAFGTDDGTHRWTASPGGRGYVYPAFADGTLYVGSPGPLRAYRRPSGLGAVFAGGPEESWRGRGPVFCTWPAVADDLILVGDRDRDTDGVTTKLRAFEDGGGVRWRVELPGSGRAPAVNEDAGIAVAAAGEDPSTLVAVSLGDGEVSWRREVEPFCRDPVVAGDVVLVGGGTARTDATELVSAFDLRTGDRLWQLPLEEEGSHLVAVGDRLYVGTDAGRVVAFE